MGWNVIQIYGLTETAPAISICEPQPAHAALSQADRARHQGAPGGRADTSGELRVVDDKGRDVPADGTSAGEIVARGNVVMEGYTTIRKRPSAAWVMAGFTPATRRSCTPTVTWKPHRLKDVIISGGENISSVEVEAMLLRHDAVQEVAVVGLPHEKWGEAPHAFVVFKDGQTATEDTLREFCRANMAHFKVPQGFTASEGTAEDGDGKDSEVRIAARSPET